MAVHGQVGGAIQMGGRWPLGFLAHDQALLVGLIRAQFQGRFPGATSVEEFALSGIAQEETVLQ